MKSFLALSRFSSLGTVLGLIALALLPLDLGLRLATGLAPRQLTRTEFLNPEYLTQFGSRVSAIELQQARHQSSQLNAILGFSTAREGIVEEQLDREAAGPSTRWVNLAGSGASFYELAYYMQPLVWSNLRPKLIVLGVHPAWLAGRVATPPVMDVSPGGMLSLLRAHHVGQFAQGLKRWSWLVFNRNRVNLNLERELRSARAEVFLDLGQPLDGLFAPAQDPWHVERRYEGRADQRTITEQMAQWERFRWFEPSRYTEDSTEQESLSRVLDDCERLAQKVVIVWLPETLQLRSRMPRAAEDTFHRVLARRAKQLPVIDLRSSLPEAAFYDNVHVNKAARGLLTSKVAQELSAAGAAP